ncbi:MAG: hypothetical protein ABSG35_17375 [Syntrophobacteraceae bacterium]
MGPPAGIAVAKTPLPSAAGANVTPVVFDKLGARAIAAGSFLL